MINNAPSFWLLAYATIRISGAEQTVCTNETQEENTHASYKKKHTHTCARIRNLLTVVYVYTKSKKCMYIRTLLSLFPRRTLLIKTQQLKRK